MAASSRASSRYESYVLILTEYLTKHNPRKLVNVPKLIMDYEGHEDALFQKLALKYGEPVFSTHRVEKEHTSVFEKLTDASAYTGAHKHRFDDEGKGRGLDGRDYVAKGRGINVRRPVDEYTGWTSTGTESQFRCPSEFLMRSDHPRQTHLVVKKQEATTEQLPIFERLTDHKLYVGAHKARFDDKGKGRGLAGRDYVNVSNEIRSADTDWGGYTGNTNTGTEVNFQCISQFLGNTRGGPQISLYPSKTAQRQPVSPSPSKRRPQSASPRRAAASPTDYAPVLGTPGLLESINSNIVF